MSKTASRQKNKSKKITLAERFQRIDTSDFPDFYGYQKPLERGLWILWVAKDRLGIKKLTAEQVASIIIEAKEIRCDPVSITRSFSRAGDKIQPYQEAGNSFFEIMIPGKEHLISQIKEGSTEVFYFEPGKRYTSKRVLAKSILVSLKGELRIVDPYCGERTLDILNNVKNKVIKFLTRLDNLKGNQKQRFLRDLKDFKAENPKVQFRDYPHADIHDRYIISSHALVVLGHSIKDLGAKESFALVLDKDTNTNIVEALIENFNRRWKPSNIL